MRLVRPSLRPTVLVAPAAALLTLSLVACSDGGADVVVATVETQDVAEVVDAPGSVAAAATATVAATGTGTVADLRVTEGQRVSAGDVLLVVDSPDAEQALADAREADSALVVDPLVPAVDLGADQVAARQAAADAFHEARVRALEITEPELQASTLLAIDNAEAQYHLAIASADAAAEQLQAGVSAIADAVSALGDAQRIQTQAAVAAAEDAVDALTVRAPISGTVSLTASESGSGGGVPADLSDPSALLGGGGAGAPDLDALLGGGGAGSDVSGVLRAGQPVSSGQPLLTITDDSQLSVAAQVDETDVLLVESGTAARVVLDAVPGEPLEAEVVSIDPAPTTSARGGVAFTIRVPLPEEESDQLLPGMSAIVGLTVREAPDVPVVPAAAVIRRDGGDAVWVVDDEGRARLQPVELGVLGDGIVEVVDGVDEGDRVVTTSPDLVDEGQEVE